MSLNGFFAGRVQTLFTIHALTEVRSLPTPHHASGPETDNEYAPIRFPRDFFNFAELTPAIPSVDREYLSMVRSIVKSATDILRFLLTSNTRALSGMAPRRQRHFFPMYGRMQLIPS